MAGTRRHFEKEWHDSNGLGRRIDRLTPSGLLLLRRIVHKDWVALRDLTGQGYERDIRLLFDGGFIEPGYRRNGTVKLYGVRATSVGRILALVPRMAETPRTVEAFEIEMYRRIGELGGMVEVAAYWSGRSDARVRVIAERRGLSFADFRR